MKLLWSLSWVVLLVGCATSQGFDRGALSSQMREGVVEIDSPTVREELQRRAQLPVAYRLGVYFHEGRSKRGIRSQVMRWSAADRDKILCLAGSLKKDGVVGDLFLISESTVVGHGPEAIRIAAAKHGADAVLIVAGAADIDRYNNKLGLLYSLIITGFVIPATEIDSLYVANATMWDVKNNYLYLSVDAESIDHQLAPWYFIDESKSMARAKSVAVDKLTVGINERLRNLSAK